MQLYSMHCILMCKTLEQQGKNTMGEVARFTETLLNEKWTSKSNKRKGAEGDLETQRKNLI